MEAFELIEKYGLSVVLLIGCMYALYKFFFFSIRELKNEFTKRHETMRENMENVKDRLSNIEQKISTLIELLKK
tara:strand:- start:2386 stop:2607 length:222 start_codon:yes stop_codon:yes gene_type:complete